MSDRFFSSQIVMSYDDYTIYNEEDRYFVVDTGEGNVSEVFLRYIVAASEYDGDPVNLGGDYDGQTDDLMWIMSFEKNLAHRLTMLTAQGMRKCQAFLVKCAFLRKEILDAGEDTVEDIEQLPDITDMDGDVQFDYDEYGSEEPFECQWNVTDNLMSPWLKLTYGIDYKKKRKKTHNEQ